MEAVRGRLVASFRKAFYGPLAELSILLTMVVVAFVCPSGALDNGPSR